MTRALLLAAEPAAENEPRRLYVVPNQPPKGPPLPPPPPTLQGIQSGISEVLRKLDTVSKGQHEHSGSLERIEETLTVHGFKIGAVERKVEAHAVALAEHGERLVDLERLPRARAPHPSEIDRYDPEETPHGGIRVEPSMWAGIQKVLSDLREQVDASDQAREIERASAEAVKTALEKKADEDAEQADRVRKQRDALRAWLALSFTVAVALVGLVAYLARLGH